jgi:hypothetical protein
MNAVRTLALTLTLASCGFGDEAADNPVYEHLVEEGIAINDKTIKLPQPTLSVQADAQMQDQVVHKIAAKKHGYNEFVRKSQSAPVLVVTDTEGSADNGDRVQRVDSWFVAYGKMSDLSDEDLMGQLVGGGSSDEKGESEKLSDEQLKERNLTVHSNGRHSESYSHIRSPLLNKVLIEGIGHGVTTRQKNSTLAASLLDDPKFPNRWRLYERTEAGAKKLSSAHPYAGFGGYCQVVELVKPEGALFIECHLAINEPHGWFDGKGYLRSKLPILMQDNVRTIRRKLAKSESAHKD